jgi:hypothetical protein
VITLDDEYRLDIALYMNRRVLMKYGENLYSDLVKNRENWTLWFYKPELPFCIWEYF